MRTWLVLPVMAVAVPLVLFSIILLIRNVNTQAEQTELLVRDRARQLAEDVDRELARLIAAAEVLATSESLARDDLAAFHRQAVDIRERLDTNVVLRDRSNRQLVNSRVPWGTPLPLNAGFEVDRRAVETRKPQVSGVVMGALTRQPLLIVVTPVIRDGEVRYLLSLTIPPDRLRGIVSPDRIPPDWRAGVIDQTGVVIARSHLADEFVGKRLPDSLWSGMQAGDGVHRAINLEGVSAFQAYSRSHTSGWVVATSVPNALLAGPARQSLVFFTGGGLALFLIGIAAAVAFGRRLTLPVARLALAAEDLGAGRRPAADVGDVAEFTVVGHAIGEAADLIRRRETALADSEARYRAIVQTAVDAMVVIDEAGLIQSFNPAAEHIFGYAADEAVGRNVKMLMPEPYRSAHDDYLANHRMTGERRIIGMGREVTGRRKDGSTFPIELAVAEWMSGGRRYFTGIIRNITERKRAEDALRASKAEADRANVAKSKFLAAASHDLRQPVQAMMLFQAVLEERLGANHPAFPPLNSLGEAMGGLRLLLDSLLDVSRLDAGLIVPHPTDIAIRPLLDRLAAEYQPQAEAKGLRLKVVRADALVRSDPALLERILRNLVENALRYTTRGGVLIGCRRQGGRLTIQVIDTGIGIAPDQQNEIFEEFFQVGNPERDRSKGLGLGLAVVRRLSRLLGHEVGVRSVPERGSAFSVDLPMIARPVLPPEQPTSGPRPGDRQGLILVIDDEPLVRMGFQAMLEGWGYRVLTAGSIEDAISHIESGEWPSAILADYRLRGGETGLDAIRAVRESLDAPVPATVITGDTAPERLVEVQAGGHALLHKPIAAHELREAVVKMLPA